MKSEQILREFDETFIKLLAKISLFEQENFTTKPAANKWSAGQVARHLIKANSNFTQMISGPTQATEREPDELVGKIKADFLNFEREMKSPDFIIPEDENYIKKDLVDSLDKIKSDITDTAQKADLTKISTGFNFSVYGYLTGLEALSFVVYHVQRHIHQLAEIHQSIDRQYRRKCLVQK